MLRHLPSIDRLLGHPLWDASPGLPHGLCKRACQEVVEEVRDALRGGSATQIPTDEALASAAIARAVAAHRPALRRVINATGVLLHTNLGRAPLAASALDAIGAVAGRYTNLEMDLESGQRDSRHARLAGAFAEVIGAGDVVVTNNNAAAVFLALSALAGAGAGVVVSRGELVEIGGSFRMPEIMEASGSRLIEVGATNRTHLRDYAAALDAGARVIMKVHQSNFAQVGFTSEVSIEELGELARSHGALLLHDLGMGVLDHTAGVVRGPGAESVRRSLDAGAQVVLFSGDKLLGGPQAGILAGDPAVLARVRAHPVMRLVRPGKLTLLALEATLRAWRDDPTGGGIPIAQLMARSPESLRGRADALAEAIARAGVRAEVVPTESAPGGGSLPGLTLPSFAVAVAVAGLSDDALAAALRSGPVAIVGRVERGRVVLDVRSLLDGDDAAIAAAIGALP